MPNAAEIRVDALIDWKVKVVFGLPATAADLPCSAASSR